MIRKPSVAVLWLILLCAAPALAQAPPYLLFESGPVRPVALSPDGSQLFVANTPSGYLEIFHVGPGGLLTPRASVPVGLEPVAVAARSDAEVWVVNHLSDSLSIVDVASSPPRVTRTLLVGDEPRDIVFAGTTRRAFISTAHRGQQRTHASLAGVTGSGDPQLTTEGIGRADVWIFDAANPGSALGGVPLRIQTFFSDTPRALATDGTTVYVAAFHSGNRTTGVAERVLEAVGRDGFVSACAANGIGLGVPGPATNQQGIAAPASSLLVQRIGASWVDSLGCTWTPFVPFSLPDRDVFAMNANSLVASSIFTGVGTILFDMALNPVTGRLYVSNTESPNLTRFEGPGLFGGSTVQGHLSESRITVIDPAGASVAPKHLNPHIDYGQLHTDAGANHVAIDAQIPHSLATPLQIAVANTPGDQKVYVAAFGSAKIGVLDASELEDPAFATSFDPTTASAGYIATGGGPAGLALSGANDRLYVLTRFDQSVEVYDVGGPAHTRVQKVRLPTPEPPSVIEGRPFLYDAVATSGNGEASCASCHIFGDLDSLAWNLGNPDDVETANPQPQVTGPAPPFHPMKGPMTTQTLRGMSTHGGLHWRGDRTNGFFGVDACDGSSLSNAACDEDLSFNNFIVAFEGLIGMEGTISPADMQKFTDFALDLMLPPNPVANLDGTQTAAQAAGESIYFTVASDGQGSCNACHTVDEALGFFGADGRQSMEGLPQRVKVPHLRNAYQKIGKFGFPGQPNTGEQVRGFGFLHDGAVDTMFNFIDGGPFAVTSLQAQQLEQFMLAFPSDVAPVVGQQVSIGPGSPGSCTHASCVSCLPGESACQDVGARIALLQSRAGAAFSSFVLGPSVTECDVIAKTVEAGETRGYLRQSDGSYLPDDGSAAISEAALRAKAGTSAQDIQYLCAPPGSGPRMAIDRDLDSVLDGLDNCPAWPNGAALGTCTAGAPEQLAARCTSAGDCGSGGFCSLAQEDGNTNGTGDACEPVLLPEPDATSGLVLCAGLLAALSRRRGAAGRPGNLRAGSCVLMPDPRYLMWIRRLLIGAVLAGVIAAAASASAQSPYLLFESGPVRPVALSPDGSQLFVTNTPSGHLEIFDVGAGGLLTPRASVPVGLEPVAVAVRSNAEVWVVNHLSDSVSIVDVASVPPRVRRTLLVGDEPRDIVFAGTPQRAFISTAHRGQQRTHASIAGVTGSGDPQLTTEGIGRADLWVFDAATPGSALGGMPTRILSFFADTPRALATDGTTVYLAAFHSGNRTTVINQAVLAQVGRAGFVNACAGNGTGLGIPGPATNQAGSPAPSTSLIVQRVGANWVDSLGCTWNPFVPLSLPDRDVFAVNANTLTPGTLFSTVGTILFNMAVNPVTGRLYVSNTESPSLTAFEGPGVFGGSTVQGRLSESRITVIDPGTASVSPKHLNQHIDYDQLHTDAGANHAAIEAQKPHSLATPLQVVVSDTPGDQKVYVAAFGSAKVGVIDASDLEDPGFAVNFDPTHASAGYIATGGGPAGLALSDANDRLYVLTRFDQSISVYAVGGPGSSRLQAVKLPTPEPASVVEGRPFLYDAVATSGNGEASCSSCHIFGDLDSLGWNLGNPDDVVTSNPQPLALGGPTGPFHPMKGPMTTQTLRGLSTHGAMHWRGDRANGFFGVDACAGSSVSNAACDEVLSFENFIVAFEGLIGMEGIPSTAEMQTFTDFALQLMLPPNPIANLDGSLTPAQANAENIYFNVGTDAGGTVPCDTCHTLDEAQGFFGTGGAQSNEGLVQRAKIPHLRNTYQKVGMFGFPGQGVTGDQVRGFGYLHDGSVDTVLNFFELGMAFTMTVAESQQMEQFMLAFPSDVAPIVGQQVSIGPGSPGSCTTANCASCLPGETACQDVGARITLLQTRAAAPFASFVLGGSVTECEVVAKTVEAGESRGYLRQSDGSYLPDDGGAAISEAALRAKAGTSAQNIQYLCAPPGSGPRMGIDRDLDSVLDGLDNCPAWPNGASLGTCTAGAPEQLAARCTSAGDCGSGGFCSLAQEDGNTNGTGDACEPVLLPEPDAAAGLALGAALLAVLSRRSGAHARARRRF